MLSLIGGRRKNLNVFESEPGEIHFRENILVTVLPTHHLCD
jgi:hypothetical protein